MQLSDLLGLPVYDSDGTSLGTLIDVRLSVTGDLHHRPDAPKSVRRHRESALQVLISGIRTPPRRSAWVLASLLRWRHRGTFLTLWRDVDDVTHERLTLRRGATRYSPVLNEQ